MPSSFVYKITNKINKKIYIGKANNPFKRIDAHLKIIKYNLVHKFYAIHNAIIKYGKENFLVEIIEECDSEDQAFEREIYWISYYKSNIYGYNILKGGRISAPNIIFSSKEKQKIIKNFVKRFYSQLLLPIENLSDSFKQCILDLRIWKKIFLYEDISNYFNISTETIKYILSRYKNGIPTEEEKHINRSNGHKGKKHSEEHKRKISEGNMGRIITEDARAKISIANSGEGNGMFNQTHSLEAREKMSEFQSSREREPLTEKHKDKLKIAAANQDRSFRIPKQIKVQIIKLWSQGKHTKKQLAEKFNIKYNTIVKIIRVNI